ncbi:glycogen-debranching protein [Desulforhopalus sp. IMCC35007]|uniref:glycogen debranching protein n=1 Tax=Desulforhopalus sp. IMCC35007 TaxID=2569543 RepID=UPI001F107EAB|nr:isoamylase [Desulforhopalus sp. IMCC35007]
MPRGTTSLKEGINFSLFARNATAVTLVIEYQTPNQTKAKNLYIPLDPQENRTGDMWHILLQTNNRPFTYGYQISHSSKKTKPTDTILVDPYAQSLLPRRWGQTATYGSRTCCKIEEDNFDWQDDRPLKIPLSDTIIYELHLRGFTRNPNSGVKAPGTYLGLIEKIPYLKKLGITAVELMPITEFDENDVIFVNPETGKPLQNYWGYSPVSFFAIKSGYAYDPDLAVTEFKTMVKELHRAGIEVFLDMVYNHTAEGGYDGTTSSFRGIDNSIYYLLGKDGAYHNFSGCGNTFNCNHPVVRDLIKESLQYWVTEMHVDGFRFDLASILGRDQQGNVLSNPPMIEIIGEDPVLRDTKMIAEAWDAAGLYQVGSFSTDSRWAEWNGRFRDDVRAFMLGKEKTVSHLATRIAGSSDLYETSGRSPLCSINFVTSHDGFTLYDLVSYNEKHNLPNGEGNKDGDNHNLSWNCGQEGPTNDPNIIRLRLRKTKTFAVLLLLSQGVPMLLAGDEFGRTQHGNNNAWCQDNETSWIDWSLLEKNRELFGFYKNCIKLRQSYKIFRLERFFLPDTDNSGVHYTTSIRWQYLEPGVQNWLDDCHGLAFHLYGEDGDGSVEFFIMVNNGSDQLSFLPPVTENQQKYWYTLIDTSKPSPNDFLEIPRIVPLLPNKKIPVKPFSCVVLQGK